MIEPIETYERDGFIVKIVYDEDPVNPREWDNLWTLAFARHRRYGVLGDEEFDPEKAPGTDDDEEFLWTLLRSYEHGSIAVAFGLNAQRYPFDCPWDSAYCGEAYVSKAKLAEEGITEEQAWRELQCELDDYNAYLNGAVYGWQVEDPVFHEVESCYGYYDFEMAKDAAEEEIDYFLERFYERHPQAKP